MRSISSIAIAALLTVGSANAQRNPVPTGPLPPPTLGFGCFSNLQAPDYPRSALQAGVDGSVWATIHIGPQGAIDKIDTEVISMMVEQGPKLLVPPVEKIIRAAKVNSTCNGKTVTMVFRYRLEGDRSPNPVVTSKTEEPNVVLIDGQPATGAAAAEPKGATKTGA